jgi:uncharacterized protein (DUF924 family)
MSTPSADPAWVGEVLDFWFREIGERDWYGGGSGVDARVRDRFAALHTRLAGDDVSLDSSRPREILAAIIVLDQFSRHLYRGSAAAFAGDPLACRYARAAVAQGLDFGLTGDERQFLYMPLQHSEHLADQALSVQLVRQLGHAVRTRYAEDHRDVIAKFGRFPHRNAVLGRESTAAERDALAEGVGASW